ncbi:MAG: hypothetical protein U1E63_16715 [Burkholderiales bacterium]
MLGLEVVPLLFFTLGALCSWLIAWPGGLMLKALASAQRWAGEPAFKAVRRAVFWALMAHLAVAAGMDALTGTRHSLMAVIPVLNTAQCAPNCYSWTQPEGFSSGIHTVGDYQRTVVGSGSAAWLQYLAWQLPGIVAAYLALASLNPWQTEGRRSMPGLAAVTAVSVGLALAFGMTLVVGALLALLAPA